MSTIVLQLKDVNPNWQRGNIQAAAAYLREIISKGIGDARAKVAYEGLLDVLDPSRRTARLQREKAATAAAVPVHAARERRTARGRRVTERRRENVGAPAGLERRSGVDRRRARERRNEPR